MPNLTNLVVKKNDGVTDITWTGDVASSGNSPARYSSKTVSSVPAFQPKLAIAAQQNPQGSVRRLTMNMVYPYAVTDSVTGRTSEVSRVTARVEVSVPQDIPQTVVDEAVSQLANLVDTADVVSMMKTQQAAT